MEQTSAGRGRYHHGALKESLIEGACRLLADKGVTGFSLHELARRVGVSVAAPYRHFENRDALLGAVATRGYEQLLRILGESMNETADPVDQLRCFGVCYIQFAIDNPELFGIMFNDRYRSETEAAQRASFAPMIDFVGQAQRVGVLTPGVPAPEIARFLWASAHGLTVLHLNGGFKALGIDDTPRALIDSAWSAFLGDQPREDVAPG
ncbi:TetR/AcrR family transcriptional regulator [Actinacidiphila rubida]|uniref:Transcriptional regulator, TetR family n=1 Tax=Actinacidiphila rubida TaxID=310780 RepID=A0A1H8JCX4_9ACTN|nr:TetR/AcrR family transcriptional regulator [Actinacidiphila rubida]SEN78632.1 transcriptional regulator, TetR family [Actinacidiphila rubida]